MKQTKSETETLQWLKSLTTLMQKSFWWRQSSITYKVPLAPPTSWDFGSSLYHESGSGCETDLTNKNRKDLSDRE